MNKLKKSQFAMEFIILVAFMLIVFFGFFATLSYKLVEVEETKKQQAAENIAALVGNEIKLARTVSDGYERRFNLPKKVDGNEYSIKIVDGMELVVNYTGYEHVLFLPENVKGNIGIGINEMRKIKGVIYLSRIIECDDNTDNDRDNKVDLNDEGCADLSDNDETNCGDGVCEGGESCTFCVADCGNCPLPTSLIMKGLSNIISFDNNGNAVLKGTLSQNSNPAPTADDEFIFNGGNGNSIAIVNLITGNMFIKGVLQENQQTLAPSGVSNDFIVKNSNGNVVSFIDESGNLYLKGTLTQNGNP